MAFLHPPSVDDYHELHSERGFRAEREPVLTIYWPPARPTPVLQLNRSAVDLMAPTDEPLLVAVLVSRSAPERLALEHRATGLKLSAARQASGGRLVNLVSREQCPIRVPLRPDEDNPGRLLGQLPDQTLRVPSGDSPDLLGIPPPAPMLVPRTQSAATTVAETLQLAQTLPPPNLTPAPTPEDLMTDEENGNGGDDEDEDDE